MSDFCIDSPIIATTSASMCPLLMKSSPAWTKSRGREGKRQVGMGGWEEEREKGGKEGGGRGGGGERERERERERVG